MALHLTAAQAAAFLHGKNPAKQAARKRAVAKQKKGRLFEAACLAHGLPEPVAEYPFAKEIGRDWRFDWLFEGEVALEIEGNPWASVNGQKSRHFHGQGILDDMAKYNEAALLGYLVLRVTWAMVEDGSAFALVRRALGLEAP